MFETEAQEIDVAGVSCLLESALAQRKGYERTFHVSFCVLPFTFPFTMEHEHFFKTPFLIQ